MGRGRAQASRDLIEAALEILEDIQPTTIRSVCYQLFIRGIIKNMSKGETNKVSRLLTAAREEGALPWPWVTDETREAERAATWADPNVFLRDVRGAYRRDHWQLQPVHLEVWSEKGTIRGVLAPVLHEYGVTFRVMHGYASATSVRDVVLEAARCRKPFRVLYVGDWDPSGLHMSDVDLPGRLRAYWGDHLVEDGVPLLDTLSAVPPITITRIALTELDVFHGELPSFPLESKAGDPRSRWYRDYMKDMDDAGDRRGRCWELDAMNPNVLRDRVDQAILAEIDEPAWERCTAAEAAEQESLATVLDSWHSIVGQAQQYEAPR